MESTNFIHDIINEDLAKNPEWVMTEESDEQTYFDIPYTFMKYERR